MAGDSEKLVQEFQQMNKTAFVLGYTGEVGKELVKALLGSRIFSKVVLIGRRTVTYEDELYKDVVSVTIAFVVRMTLRGTGTPLPNIWMTTDHKSSSGLLSCRY